MSVIVDKSTKAVRLLGIDYMNLKATESRIPDGRVIDLDCSNTVVVGSELISIAEIYLANIMSIYNAEDSKFLPVFDE